MTNHDKSFSDARGAAKAKEPGVAGHTIGEPEMATQLTLESRDPKAFSAWSREWQPWGHYVIGTIDHRKNGAEDEDFLTKKYGKDNVRWTEKRDV